MLAGLANTLACAAKGGRGLQKGRKDWTHLEADRYECLPVRRVQGQGAASSLSICVALKGTLLHDLVQLLLLLTIHRFHHLL